MKSVIAPPLTIAGTELRAICEIEVVAHSINSGVVASGDKRPIAILFGTGSRAQLISIDGKMIEPADIGLAANQLP